MRKSLYILSLGTISFLPSAVIFSQNIPKNLNKLIKQAQQKTVKLEKEYSARAGQHLKLYGYDFFTKPLDVTKVVLPVNEDYVLGPGDELIIYLIGLPPGTKQIPPVIKTLVDRQGNISIPGIGVFSVWGLTLKEAEEILKQQLGVNLKLTVGRLRTFPVYITGEVDRPGAHIVTGVNTILDALTLAGVKKTGSLRDVVLTRKTGKGLKIFHIDLYKVFIEGKPLDLTLKDGDTILVKPIGSTAAIAGEVKRPAIYEIKGNETIEDLINLAGGLLPSSYKYKVILQRYKNGELQVLEDSLENNTFLKTELKDGDLVLVKKVADIPENAYSLEGYITLPGIYEYKKGLKISQVLNENLFYTDTNLKFALLIRQYPKGSVPQYIAFSPEKVLNGKEDFKLKPYDRLVFFKLCKFNIDEVLLEKIDSRNKREIEAFENVKNPIHLGESIYHSDLNNLSFYKHYSFNGLPTSSGKYGEFYRQRKNYYLPTTINSDNLQQSNITEYAKPDKQQGFSSVFSPEFKGNQYGSLHAIQSEKPNWLKKEELQHQENICLNTDYLKFVKNYVIIEGYYEYQGPIACSENCKLSEILDKRLLLKDTNLEYAEIERYDLKTLQRKQIIEFRPLDILEGKKDIELQPYDKIILYPKYIYKPIKVSGDILNPLWVTYHPGITLEEVVSHAKFKYPIKELKVIVKTKKGILSFYLNDLRKHPSPLSRIKLNPGSEVVIKKVKEDELVSKVYVYGQVWRPGVYKVDEKTTLYDVLKAAGGFKPDAYPKGLVLLRRSIVQMQRERLQKALALLKAQLLKEEAGYMQAEMEKSQKEAFKEAFKAKGKLLEEMEKTQVTGRLVGLNIPPNLEALKNSPSNIILEDGDQIYIPKKPSAVLVFGEVQNPSAILYRKDLKVKDYIALAGGLTKDADVDDIFIIKANGVAISKDTYKSLIEWNSEQKRFIWGYAYNDILNYKLEPGDAIIVPTKIHVPIMWRPLIKDVVQIIYQSALTVYTITNL